METPSEFQVVKRKRWKKKGGDISNSQSKEHVDEKDDSFDIIALKKRLKEYMQELRLSEFFQHCNEKLLRSEETEGGGEQGQSLVGVSGFDLLSFGIGRFSSCPIARYQLAFLLVLREKLKNPPCHVYDPVFSTQEKIALEDLGCTLIHHNEEGKHVCRTPTLLFMPHCGKALYNNLVWANLATLDNLVIIGNSFSRMLESTPHRILKQTANYVIKVSPYVTETPLKSSSFVHTDVFNDLALHSFSRLKLTTAPEEFWEGNEEPIYDTEEVEIIRNDGSCCTTQGL